VARAHDWTAGRDSVKERLQEAAGHRGEGGSDENADGDAQGGAAGEVGDDLLALGAEGHADADFAAALGDGAGENAVRGRWRRARGRGGRIRRRRWRGDAGG